MTGVSDFELDAVMAMEEAESEPHSIGSHSPTGEIDLALRLALIAPSPRNSQPWIFTCPKPTAVDLRRDLSRARPVGDPHNRELTISCGVALQFLQVGLASLGVEAKAEVLPRPGEQDLLARVETTGEYRVADEVAKNLVTAACARRTNWGEFFDLPLTEQDLGRLLTSVPQDVGTGVSPVPDDQRAEVDELIAEADRRQLADPRFVTELSRWPVGRPRDHADSASAGTLLLLSTPNDDDEDWVAAGQALAQTLLVATELGLSTTFVNQPIQIPDLRARLGQVLSSDGVPQQLVRFGFATAPAAKTPRREIEDMLVELGAT